MDTPQKTSRSFNPYFAGLSGKSGADADALEDRIEALPSAVRDFLFSPELPEQLSSLAQSVQLPEQYSVALAKIVFLIIIGDVPLSVTGQLLGKLGIDPQMAATLASSLDQILKPLIAARAQQSVAQGMRPLEPLTQRIGVPTPPPTSNAPARNIIDLRNKPLT